MQQKFENFKVGEVEYQVRKIDALKQFHLVRRLAPLLGELAPVLGKAAGKAKAVDSMSEEQKLEAIAEFATPIMNGLSKLSDEDSDKVLFGLLACVQRKQEQGNWAGVAAGNSLMFSDLELPAILQLAGRAFIFNLSGFFGGLPRVS